MPNDPGFTIVIDTAEQSPYLFKGVFQGELGEHYTPKTVRSVLTTGDYSILGMENQITVERKNPADLFSSLASGRDRFIAEHQRMAQMHSAAVVFECSVLDLLMNPPPFSEMNPDSVFSSSLSWPQRYGVHWIAAGSREVGELVTFRFLQQYFKKMAEPQKRVRT